MYILHVVDTSLLWYGRVHKRTAVHTAVDLPPLCVHVHIDVAAVPR